MEEAAASRLLQWNVVEQFLTEIHVTQQHAAVRLETSTPAREKATVTDIGHTPDVTATDTGQSGRHCKV